MEVGEEIDLLVQEEAVEIVSIFLYFKLTTVVLQIH